jgi:hypothetical protein
VGGFVRQAHQIRKASSIAITTAHRRGSVISAFTCHQKWITAPIAAT